MKRKIKAVLKRYGHTQNDLAELLGITYQSVSIKLNGHKDFTQTEIFKIMTMYDLSAEEVADIFFNIRDRFESDDDAEEE